MLPRAAGILTQVAKPRRFRPRPGSPGATITPPPAFAPPRPPPVYDYSTDPALAHERAYASTDLEASRHSIDARRRAALLGFGSRDLAMKTLGLAGGDPLIQSIDESADTGTGALARLAHDYAASQRTSDENLNRQNSFFSSSRTKALADLAYANNQRVAGATQQIQGLLEGLTAEGAQAQSAYGSRLSAAEQAAMGRELDFNLQYPQAPSMDASLAAVAAAAKSGAKPPARRRPAAARILAGRRPRYG